jgi:1-acyl-sn-glycerol-3-phosphate acyltransferase
MVWSITNLVLLKPINKLWVKEVIGIENIPKPPFIIASNHISYFDPFIIIFIFFKLFKQKIRYVAGTENYGHKLGDWIFTGYCGCIPTDLPKGEFFGNIKSILENNEIVGIFPEKNRHLDGKVHLFKKGIGRIAIESGKPVIPVAIKGTNRIWPSNKRFPLFRKIARVNIGKPFSFKDYNLSDRNCINVAYKVEQEVRELFKKL